MHSVSETGAKTLPASLKHVHFCCLPGLSGALGADLLVEIKTLSFGPRVAGFDRGGNLGIQSLQDGDFVLGGGWVEKRCRHPLGVSDERRGRGGVQPHPGRTGPVGSQGVKSNPDSSVGMYYFRKCLRQNLPKFSVHCTEKEAWWGEGGCALRTLAET